MVKIVNTQQGRLRGSKDLVFFNLTQLVMNHLGVGKNNLGHLLDRHNLLWVNT